MCGIAGFWQRHSGRPADEAVLRAMVGALEHRGPDEDGYWIDGSLGIGMRRLRVIDPAGGQQPMANEDGAVRVVFNGEVYNHAQLRDELRGHGHTFRTRSDTEVVVHAYEEWGPACVERFNGMFAFAVWDARRQRLMLARDRLGIKPLYFHEGREGLVFGSELKALVASPEVPVEWDLEAVDDFLTYEYVPAPRTILRDVQKLPPAHTLLIDRNRAGAVPRRFWRLEATAAAPPADAAAAAELRRRLQTSVERRLIADVPLGAFLSGGVDSSIVVGLMSRAASEVRSFSLGFHDRSYNELEHARVAADHFGTRHRESVVEPDIVEMAASLADHFDEPFADVSAFPTYLISSLARREVTVALSGDGGDELFAGYDHYRAHRWAARLRWLGERWPAAAVDRVLARVRPSDAKKGVVNLAKRFVEGVRRPADLEHARWWVFWDQEQRGRLYSRLLRHELSGRDCFAFYRGRLAEGRAAGFEGLQRQLYADITGYLPDDILTKVDRMSMAVSLEARVPFLDHEVVEYAMTIPADAKLRRGRSKWILKHAFRQMVPGRILSRSKQGFSIPLKNWLRGPLQPLMRELLGPEGLGQRGWFEAGEVERAVREHTAGIENHAHRLWCLMSLELSLRGLRRRANRRTAGVRQEVAP